MKSATNLGVDFFMSNGLQDFICDWAEDDCDLEEEIKSFEWWKGFDESKTDHFDLFITTLEYLTRRLSELILELDKVFDKFPPKNLGIDLSRCGWEIIAVEWIREEEEQAYLFHYGTAGEYFFYTDFVLAERRQCSEDFMELKRRERFMLI